MSTLLHFSLIVLLVGFGLMGLAIGVGHLIGWYRGRQFAAYLKKMSTED